MNKEEILSKISHELYINSRIPVSELVKKLGTSHQTVSKYIKELETRYSLRYTLDVNLSKLGFWEPRIITLKLDGMPDKKKLADHIKNYTFVQNAYLGKGDFDIIIHAVAPMTESYVGWEYTMRIELNRYKPKIEIATLNNFTEGFLPLKKETILMSDKITNNEKVLLSLLMDNSRMKLKDLIKKSGLSQMKVIYCIRKLEDNGVIKRFTTSIQKPDKNFFIFSGISIIPNETHHSIFLKKLVSEIVPNENKNNISTDYSVICDTSGHFDSVTFTCFRDGDTMYKRGPELIERLWKDEHPRIETSILTEVLVGQWPFNCNSYIKTWRSTLVGKYDKKRTYHLL
jgi:DNA-binding Lrp family transcriptional regulator